MFSLRDTSNVGHFQMCVYFAKTHRYGEALSVLKEMHVACFLVHGTAVLSTIYGSALAVIAPYIEDFALGCFYRHCVKIHSRCGPPFPGLSHQSSVGIAHFK